ncbi:MAG TPA: helix-turn-helix domain-containing protein [Candidatus Stercorousia faecigallinarum]|jgi:hypothetical protein|nr:helix-turn-helix domain-containing protein [Candidatus Stercorousia faecigallinarum]
MKNNVIQMNKGTTEEKFLRARDIQKIFNIARSTVDNWVRYGYLTRHKIGRNIFYEVSEVEKLKTIGA